MGRLKVAKTLKMYVGGKFIRSESGRTTPQRTQEGAVVNVCHGSRKDLRNALETARKAQPGWANRTAYNRGQILYRLAEMLDDRAETLLTTPEDAAASADRAVHHAGWADKITAMLSTLNPVAHTYVNYSQIKPIGVVLAAPSADDGLLGIVEALCVATVMGNSVIVLVPAGNAEIATQLTECLATCDMPGGVVNVLTGNVEELIGHGVTMDDLDSIAFGEGALSSEALIEAKTTSAHVMRRLVQLPSAATPASPMLLQRFAEVQTVWMSAYETQGGGAAY